MTKEEETKLIKFRAYLVEETERFQAKIDSVNSSEIGQAYDHGFANGLIHSRAKFEELFPLWN
jgi:hypothetical protein